MRSSGNPDLIESVMAETITMRGRMIHGKLLQGRLYEEAQDYDVHGRVCPIFIILQRCLFFESILKLLDHICR
jgi:hypothetical protein